MTLNCPSCGGPLPADERFAQLVVCGYCRSSIILDQRAARVAGQMNALLQSPGPLYVGATGKLGAKRFQVLGRVRYGYANGLWDEWFLLFDDQTPMWISEDERSFSLETMRREVDPPIAFEQAEVGRIVEIEGDSYHIDERDVATCEGGEGQLPFEVVGGAKTAFLDLSSGERFATIEFDLSSLQRDAEPSARVYLGKRIEAAELKVDVPKADWAQRDALSAERPAGAEGRERIVRSAAWSQRLNCAGCGATLPKPDNDDQTTLVCKQCSRTYDLNRRTLACATCETVVEIAGGEAARLASCPRCGNGFDISKAEITPLGLMRQGNRPRSLALRLAQEVKHSGESYRVAGIVRYIDAEHGPTYSWAEYLLHSDKLGYRYLVCENGHWSWCEELWERPTADLRGHNPGQKLRFLRKDWTVVESRRNGAKIDWVEGELPWIAQRGDTISYLDAAHPPELLSISWTAREQEYFRSTYLPISQVETMLGVARDKLPPRVGVAPHQPYLSTRFRREALVIMLALSVAASFLGIAACSQKGTSVASFSLGNATEAEEFLSSSFTIAEAPTVCRVEFTATNMANSWSYLEVGLVNEAEEVLLDFSAEMSFYSGVEGGESWREGNPTCTRNFRVEKPGVYRFLVQGVHGFENNPQAPGPGHEVQATVYQGAGISRYHWTLAGGALAWILVELIRRGAHEARRQANIETEDGED